MLHISKNFRPLASVTYFWSLLLHIRRFWQQNYNIFQNCIPREINGFHMFTSSKFIDPAVRPEIFEFFRCYEAIFALFQGIKAYLFLILDKNSQDGRACYIFLDFDTSFWQDFWNIGYIFQLTDTRSQVRYIFMLHNCTPPLHGH